jgi:hypothetical protein
MIWSKLKKAYEALLADSVKDHLQLYVTRYGPGVSYLMTRAWLTWDGAEICKFSSIEWWREVNTVAAELRDENEQSSRLDPFDHAEEIVDQRGIYSRDHFAAALEEYISLSIEEALQSANVIIRALAMFDRRLGKRRLRAIHIEEAAPAFIQRCYQLRCQAEGIDIPSIS